MKNTIDVDTSLQTLSDVIARVTKIARDISFAQRFDAANVTRELVPRDHGVYIWRTKEKGDVAYIGSAVGTDGLRQRIRAGLEKLDKVHKW